MNIARRLETTGVEQDGDDAAELYSYKPPYSSTSIEENPIEVQHLSRCRLSTLLVETAYFRDVGSIDQL